MAAKLNGQVDVLEVALLHLDQDMMQPRVVPVRRGFIVLASRYWGKKRESADGKWLDIDENARTRASREIDPSIIASDPQECVRLCMPEPRMPGGQATYPLSHSTVATIPPRFYLKQKW